MNRVVAKLILSKNAFYQTIALTTRIKNKLLISIIFLSHPILYSKYSVLISKRISNKYMGVNYMTISSKFLFDGKCFKKEIALSVPVKNVSVTLIPSIVKVKVELDFS